MSTASKGQRKPRFRVGQRVRLRQGRIYRIRAKYWDEQYNNWSGTWRYKLWGHGNELEPVQQILRALTQREAGQPRKGER
jgi:hypothetical protein